MLRAFLHDPEKWSSGFPIKIMHFITRGFEESARRVQQQSGGWAITGKTPVPSEGWTPFQT
jgi:hypothetical protein